MLPSHGLRHLARTTRPRATAIAMVLTSVASLAACGDDGPAPQGRYHVSFATAPSLISEDLGALEYRVAGGVEGGMWDLGGGVVSCTWLVDADLRVCNTTRAGELRCAIVDVAGVPSGGPLTSCEYFAPTRPTARDFDVRDLVATTPYLEPLAVTVYVSAIDEEEPSTTTTIPPPPLPFAFDVRIDLESSDRPIGALQFDAVYGGGAAVRWRSCDWLLDTELQACNTRRGGFLTCAAVDTGGFRGPAALLRCEVGADAAISPTDFVTSVTDASDLSLVPIDVSVQVSDVTLRP
jgi:hypothetical protein